MNLPRLLDQPYINRDHLSQDPWLGEDDSGLYDANHFCLLDIFIRGAGLKSPSDKFIVGFKFEDKKIDSQEAWLDYCSDHVAEIEKNLLSELFYKKENCLSKTMEAFKGKRLNFEKLSIDEKLDLLDIPRYIFDRDVMFLWELLRNYRIKRELRNFLKKD